MRSKVMVVDDSDKLVWELTTTLPRLSLVMVGVCGFLNLIIPGMGTLVAACLAQDNVSKTQMSIAVFQFFTSVFLVGFIWAQYWTYLLYVKSQEDPYTAQPSSMQYQQQ